MISLNGIGPKPIHIFRFSKGFPLGNFCIIGSIPGIKYRYKILAVSAIRIKFETFS